MTNYKTYSNLSTQSKSKLTSTVQRLERNGITAKESLKMTDISLKTALGFKGKKASFDGLKRNIRQISLDLDRKKGVLTDSLPKYVKLGYQRKGLNLIKVKLNKTIGLNTFFDIAKEVEKKYNINTTNSYSKTASMLKQAQIDFSRLSTKDKKILSFFS